VKLSTLLFIVLALALSAAVPAADTVVIKFSHVAAPNTPKGKAAEKFKALAEERSRGRVKVEVYPNSQLYKDRDEIEALQLGSVQMLAPSLSKFSSLGAREFEVFDLPYIFPNKATLYRVMDGALGKELLAKLEPKAIVGLAYWDNGFKQMSANKPLRLPADFKGLQMRIQPSKILEAQMKALGANPVPMASGEVYVALKEGVVGGAENPVSNFYAHKLHEVQKHLTLSDHGYLGYAVIVNKRFWEALPAELREILEQAMRETTEYQRTVAQEENDEALEKLRAAGTTQIHTLSPKEREAWRKQLVAVHRNFRDGIGPVTLARIYKISAEVEKEAQARKR